MIEYDQFQAIKNQGVTYLELSQLFGQSTVLVHELYLFDSLSSFKNKQSLTSRFYRMHAAIQSGFIHRSAMRKWWWGLETYAEEISIHKQNRYLDGVAPQPELPLVLLIQIDIALLVFDQV